MAYRRRHRKLGRTKGARRALLRGLTLSLLENGVLETSQARASALRGVVDRLVSVVRDDTDTVVSRRRVAALLGLERGRLTSVFSKIAQLSGDRRSGFVRMVRLGRRSGDGSSRVKVELVKTQSTSFFYERVKRKGQNKNAKVKQSLFSAMAENKT